jgi:hypothetical protein
LTTLAGVDEECRARRLLSGTSGRVGRRAVDGHRAVGWLAADVADDEAEAVDLARGLTNSAEAKP